MRKNSINTTNPARYIGGLFLLIIAVVLVVNIFTPSKEISEEENRKLASKPKVTVSGLLSGTYMDKYEEYLSDQFVGRNVLRNIKVSIARLGGAKKIENVFIGKDQQLLEDIKEPDDDMLTNNIEAINKVAEKYSDVTFNMMIVPDAANVLKDKLPALADTADQSALMSRVKKQLNDKVNWIDTVKTLNKHKKEKIYYKTDHHWTSLGAFYAFKDAAPSLGIKDDVSSMFIPYPVTLDFNGTLSAASGTRQSVKEQIDIYVPKDMEKDVIVNYEQEQKKTTTLYDRSKLDTKDKYGVFLGGNSPLIDIRTLSSNPDRLLVVKDSFANCFIPFLTPFYREIVMMDPRYYTGSFDEIMEVYNITDVLFLYSGNTFFGDNNISGVLEVE